MGLRFLTVYIFCLVCGVSVAAANEDPAPCEAQLTNSDMFAQHAHVLGSSLDMERLKSYLRQLSGEEAFPDGYTLKERGSDAGRMLTRLRIKEFVEAMGYTVSFENFGGGSNLIVEIPGQLDNSKIIELTAHYDSVGNPGADDNGSGTALLLEILSHFRQAQPGYRLRVVFMDLEEKGFQGSMAHVSKLKREDGEIVGAIVVDTIGWALDGGSTYLGVVEIGESRDGRGYEERVKFAQQLYYIQRRIGNRDGLVLSPEREGAKMNTADHGAYWHAGVPAVLIAAPYEPGFINPHYHDSSDKMEHINWPYYERMAKAITEMVAYTTRMTLKNANALSADEWAVVAALENPTIQPDQDGLIPASASRKSALPPNYRAPKSSIWDDDDDPDDHYVSSSEFDRFPSYVARFVRVIRNGKARKVYMAVLPKKGDVNQGFVLSGKDLLNLNGDTAEVFRIIYDEVRKKEGKIYSIKFENGQALGSIGMGAKVKQAMGPGKPSFTTDDFKGKRLDEFPEAIVGKAPVKEKKTSPDSVDSSSSGSPLSANAKDNVAALPNYLQINVDSAIKYIREMSSSRKTLMVHTQRSGTFLARLVGSTGVYDLRDFEPKMMDLIYQELSKSNGRVYRLDWLRADTVDLNIAANKLRELDPNQLFYRDEKLSLTLLTDFLTEAPREPTPGTAALPDPRLPGSGTDLKKKSESKDEPPTVMGMLLSLFTGKS